VNQLNVELSQEQAAPGATDQQAAHGAGSQKLAPLFQPPGY
jgi:hypothetical protein